MKDKIINLQIKAIDCLYLYISYWYPEVDLNELKDLINIPQVLMVDSLPNDMVCKYLNEKESEKIKIQGITDCILVSIDNLENSEIYSLISLVKELLIANTNFIVDDYDYTIDSDIIGLTSDYIRTNNFNFYNDILKGKIDLCREKSNEYSKNKNDSEIFKTLSIQTKIYDTLLFLGSYCSVQLKTNPDLSFREILEDYLKADNNPKSKANYLIKLLLKNNKLEVFKSIIDPISYTLGDVHYDYLISNLNKKEKKLL